jgi:protein transport protein SEC61 subunit gamma-like protein
MASFLQGKRLFRRRQENKETERPGFLQNCKRTIRVARKPDNDEFIKVAKITGLGILLIGFLGFAVMLVSYFLQGTA